MVEALLPMNMFVPDPAPATGHVYLIRVVDTNMVKIGYTTNPVRHRMSQLQVGNPNALEILALVETPRYKEIERELHQLLANRRVRGEWFNLQPDVDCEALLSKLGYTCDADL
jgi:hypothetical protein